MISFLRNTLVFTIILVLYFLCNILINRLIYANESTGIISNNILIVGDSHMQKGLDPGLLTNAENIAQAAEPYVITYWKLSKVLSECKFDTVIVGFGAHNITSKLNLFSDEQWSSELFRRIYSIEKLHEIDEIYEVVYFTYYRTLWEEISFYPKINHRNYLGKYSNVKETHLANGINEIKRHFYSDNVVKEVSVIEKVYLDSIIALCRSKKAFPVLFNSPVHKSYYEKIPKTIIKEFELMKQEYSKELLVLDFSRSLFPDSLFLDVDHLNELGAERLTNELNHELSISSSRH